MGNPFDGSIVLLTGAAGGIGRALAGELARRGARVVLTDLDQSAVEQAAAEIQEAGYAAEAHPLDVTDAEAFATVVNEVCIQEGRIDYLFNNAGIGVTGEVRDLSIEAWNKVLDINLRGVVHGVQAAYPGMVERGAGHIVNVACIAGLVPFPMTAAYCAAKHGVVALSASLRAEAKALGVKVSVVCPGTVDTALFDSIEYIRTDKELIQASIRRVLLPADRCARSILKGVARNRSIIPVTLHARATWWLYRLAPRTFLAVTAFFFQGVRSRLRTAAKNPDTP